MATAAPLAIVIAIGIIAGLLVNRYGRSWLGTRARLYRRLLDRRFQGRPGNL
jgi:hypothetical protein